MDVFIMCLINASVKLIQGEGELSFSLSFANKYNAVPTSPTSMYLKISDAPEQHTIKVIHYL